MADTARMVSDMRGAGFSEEEIRGVISPVAENMRGAGFSEKEVQDAFGLQSEVPFDTAPATDAFRSSMSELAGEDGNRDFSFMEALNAGFQQSIVGLAGREKVPDLVVGKNASMFDRVTSQVAAVTLDLPIYAIGSAIAAPEGAGALTPITATAGAFALPAALRSVLMDTYENGQIQDFGQFWDVLSNALIEEFKGFTTGAVVAVAGPVAVKATESVIGPTVAPIIRSTAVTAAEKAAQITGLVTVGSALEGEVPSAADFADAAVVIGVLTGGTRVVKSLRATYVNTGRKPSQVVEDTLSDPTIKEDLHSTNHNEMPRAYKEVRPGTPGEIKAEIAQGVEPEVLKTLEVELPLKPPPDPQSVKENNANIPNIVLRIEEKGVPISSVEKPQGLYTSPADLRSPHAELGGDSAVFYPNKDAKILHVDVSDLVRTNRGLVGQSAGIAALRNMLGESEYSRLTSFSKRELIQYLSEGYRGVDWKRYADQQEMLEGLAGIKARESGYDAIMGFDKEGSVWNEYVGLSKNAFTDAPPKTPVEPPSSSGASGGAPQEPSALEQVKERISFSEKTPRKPLMKTLKGLYADWFRAQHPLWEATKSMAHGEELSIVNDPAKLKQLEPGSTALATSFLEHSPRDFNTLERVGKPLKEILSKADGSVDDLSAYLVARRTLELQKNRVAAGKDTEAPLTGIDLGVARRAVDEGASKYEQIANEITEFQGHVLAYVKEAGLISQESFELLRAAGQDYVPLNRVMSEDAKITGRGTGKTVRNPLFNFHGSELQIVNPLESILKNTYMFIQLAHRNQVGLQLTNLAKESGDFEFVKQVKAKNRPISVTPEEIARAAKKWGEGKSLTKEEASALESFAEESFDIFRPNALTPKKNQIAVFDKGVRTIWEIDQEVYRSFSQGMVETNPVLFKVLGSFARMTRAGAVLSPEFMARNPIRDQFTAFIQSNHKFQLFIDFGRGMSSLIKKDKDFQDWQASGGPQAALVSLDRMYLQQGVRDVMSKGGLVEATRNVITHPIEMLRLLSEATESGTRIGEFKRSLKGKERTKENLLQAGLDSRNVSLDFAQMGTNAAVINQIIPFFAAGLNGMDRTFRAFKDHPVRTGSRVVAGLMIPSALLHLNNRDQDWYKDESQWRKDLFWLFRVGDTTYALPKPFELGVVFATGTERFVDSMIGKDPKAFDGFLASVFNAGTPGMVPSAVAPIIETYSNRKIFFDRPLIPERLKIRLPEYQYVQYTTEISKIMGRTIAQLPGMKNSVLASPIVLENFVSDWTSGLGRTVLAGLDLALRKSGALPDNPRSEMELADIPGIKAFVLRHPTMNTQPVQDFFDRYEQNHRVITTINQLQKEGDLESAERERQIAGTAGTTNLTSYYTAISQATKAIRQVWNPRLDIPVRERQQITDNYYIMIHQMAREGLKMIDRAEAFDKDRKASE